MDEYVTAASPTIMKPEVAEEYYDWWTLKSNMPSGRYTTGSSLHSDAD